MSNDNVILTECFYKLNSFFNVNRVRAVEYIIYCKVVIVCRKRMNTDPRLLTGQKGASTLTQWYDNEMSAVSSDHHRSFGSCTEINSVSCVLLWN